MYRGFWQDFLKITIVNITFSALNALLIRVNVLFINKNPVSIGEIFSRYIFDYEQIKFMTFYMFLPTLISISLCLIFWLNLRYKELKKGKTLENPGFSLSYMAFVGYSFLIAIMAGIISGIIILFDGLLVGGLHIGDLFLLLLPTIAIFVIPIVWFILLIILPFVLFLWQFIWNKRLIVLKTNYFN